MERALKCSRQVIWDQFQAHRWYKGFYFLIFICNFVFKKVVFHVFKGNINTISDGEDAKIKKISLALLCVREAHCHGEAEC